MEANSARPSTEPPSNLLFGVISTPDDTRPRCAAAIGKTVIELSKCCKLQKQELPAVSHGVDLERIFNNATLNEFAGQSSDLRFTMRRYFEDGYAQASIPSQCLVPIHRVTSHIPMTVGNYVDFYCSLEHAQNCSSLVGGDDGSNFYSSPLCYNGRTSSIVPSGTDVNRPYGITFGGSTAYNAGACYRPTEKLDFELEIGYFISKSLPRGKTMTIEEAPEYIFGFVMLNDWSSRDVQAFEMRPLGPFHSKGFATSISTWIVPIDTLQPFACSAKYDHTNMTVDHLRWNNDSSATFDIKTKATLIRDGQEFTVAKSQLRDLYWTPYQQLTHLASSGCGMSSGDLVGTGTISGETEGTRGCLFEATFNGQTPIQLEGEQALTYLRDFDEIILEGSCVSRDCGQVLAFGECRGRITPAT